MPYIEKKSRKEIDNAINKLIDSIVDSTDLKNDKKAGLLNYTFSKIINGILIKNYKNINEMIGMLECCKLELYRRVAAPYEDAKIKANGDVYD